MKLTKCALCTRLTRTGGLCYVHSKAMYQYNESLKWREEDKEDER